MVNSIRANQYPFKQTVTRLLHEKARVTLLRISHVEVSLVFIPFYVLYTKLFVIEFSKIAIFRSKYSSCIIYFIRKIKILWKCSSTRK
jgi:hypothetical protein